MKSWLHDHKLVILNWSGILVLFLAFAGILFGHNWPATLSLWIMGMLLRVVFWREAARERLRQEKEVA